MTQETPIPTGTPEMDDFTPGKVAGFYASIIGVTIIVAFCWSEWQIIFSLLAFAGAIAGWLVGILIAPLDKNEAERFGIFMKVISGFITGYLLSKVDPAITTLFLVDKTGFAPIADEFIAKRVLITLSSFGVSLLTVFSLRAYWSAKNAQA